MPAIVAFAYVYGLNLATDNYVTKMQFNADKDILFITRKIGSFFPKDVVEAHEVAHLQVLPPTPQTGLEDVNDRTWFTLTDMNSQENFMISTNQKYWHPSLAQDFKLHIHGLWD